jgi:hypothetical protein
MADGVSSSTGSDGKQLMYGVTDQIVEAGGVLVVDPLGECHPKEGNGGFGCDLGGGFLHSPEAQCSRQGSCQTGHFGQLPLVQLRVGIYQSLALSSQS